MSRLPHMRALTFTSLILVGICGVAQADVFRWVDDHGTAHYSDRWVPGSELIKSSRPAPSSPSDSQAAAKAPSSSAKPTDEAKQNAAAAAAVKQDVAKTQGTQCKQATERYQKAIEARRIYKPGAKEGEDRVYMSDSEIDAYRLQARNDATLACGSPPAPVNPE
jgi:hypothetical protein